MTCGVAGLDTPVGRMSVAVTAAGVCAVSWCEPGELLDRLGGVPDSGACAAVLRELREYFAGERREFTVPVDLSAAGATTATVLRTLHETVRYGRSVTYGELARRSGTGIGPRGIGAVMGANPVPVVVPCHRVLAHDGLGGYSGGRRGGGLEVKRWLLTLEGVLPPTLDWDPAGIAYGG